MNKIDVNELLRLVELNVGSIPLSAVAIIDMNFRIWAVKGKLEDILEVLKKYENVLLSKMKTGEEIHNDGSFLMKVTDKSYVLAAVKNPLLIKIAIANLRGRINALSSFYVLDKLIDESDLSNKNSSPSRTL
ncbi:MAG: hypothetical protein QXW47_07995 [Candidatus Jordarchaeales archaeon]|nr:hypothetical protein [Candidatus Jordarchaeia archaeon]